MNILKKIIRNLIIIENNINKKQKMKIMMNFKFVKKH